MKPQTPHPPRWAQRILGWYCRPEILEDLQGDLNEYFDRNVRSRGVRSARLIYVLDVLKFFRPYTIRKPEFLNLLIHWIMIGSYIKTSGRSIVRNKLFSIINIAGLAVSMSVGLLMVAFVSDLLSYDDFHEKNARIYRVNTVDQHNDQTPMNLASTSVKAGKQIRETVSGVEDITLMRRGFGGDAVIGQATIPLSGFWADESFLKVFSFPLLQGDAATALKEPYSVVLTEKSAKKLFGDDDALGKSVKFDSVTYIVTGVLQDIPRLSHLTFESLVSFSTVELQKPDFDGDFFGWENIYMTYIYLTIPENGDRESVQGSIDKLCAAENAPLDKRKISLSLQPLNSILIGKNLSNSIGPTMNSIALWILVGLAVVVILSASFNYTNLSIARSLRRSREVGIRKVIGALKSHVMGQFIAESVIISLLALGFSFLLFLFLRTQFLSLHSYVENLVSLELSPSIIAYFVILAIVVGIVSGFLPALFFSKVNAVKVLKDASSIQVFRHVSLRKALIIVQYVFSLIFITTTVIGYNQYMNFISFNLGFKTENILNIELKGNSGDLLIKELSELPSVSSTSQSLLITSLGSIYGMQMKYKTDSAGIWLNVVDEHYLPMHEHKLIAGTNFNTKTAKAEESEIIVNEQILKHFDIQKRDPNKAIGEVVIMDGKKLTIVGVVSDFHYETLEDEIKPMAFRYSSSPGGYINAKVTSTDWPAVLTSIEQTWKKIDKVHPLNAKFYDEQIEEAYSQFSVMIKVIGFLAFLAVSIASMGLFGMVVFTTETRLKEISIRKILGASEGKLIYLLSKGFFVLISLATLIALPATYFFFDKVVLINFAYHQPIQIGELFIGVLIVLMLACLMIVSQTLKVTRTNPADVLKNE